MWQPAGHVDYYPNGGELQPGCTFSLVSCSHRRAMELIIDSIPRDPSKYDCHFQSMPCESYDQFKNGTCTFYSTAHEGVI